MLLLSLLVARALAADDDDDFDFDDDIPVPQPAQPAPAPAPEPVDDGDEDDDALDTFRETGDDTDLLDGDDGPRSTDSEKDYRAAQNQLGKLEPDEQIAGWEQYLAAHPNTPYRTEIEHRIEELSDQMYAIGIDGPQDGPQDASRTEFDFAHPLQLENINPRTRVEAAFEWGLPDYANLVLDYEHALLRNFSAHAGFRRRYLGWNLEAGVRYAVVKSLRTKTLVTLIGDFRVNTNPAYPGFRPQLAVGKRFGNKLDVALLGGPDLTYRQFADVEGGALETNWTAGAMVYYAASERVGAFAEANLYLKSVPADAQFGGGVYQFDVASFGLKFFPGKADVRDKEINFGASVPVAQTWWQWHYGSIMAQLNYYL